MRKRVLIFLSSVSVFFLMLGFFLLESKISIKNDNSFLYKVNLSVLESNLKPKTNIPKEDIKMLFFGDLMLDRDVKKIIKQRGIEYILAELDKKNFFDDYDIVSANLEGAVTNNGEYFWPEKKYDFTFLPEDILKLKDYNFNFFNTANNHSYDQGGEGVLQTKENLKNMNFKFSGCMIKFKEECSSIILNIKGRKVAMLGFSLFNGFDLKKAENIILKLKREVDIIIVNIHWGDEYEIQFNKKQQKIAHKFIDAGVDLIIGHHPHVVEGVEKYKGKYIFYSLGNFIFDQYFSKEVKIELAFSAIFKQGNIEFNLYPIFSDYLKITLLEKEEKNIFFQKLTERSIGDLSFNIDHTK